MKKTSLLEITLIFAMALAAYGYFSTKADWNTSSRLALVKAVVEENRFEIDSYRGGVLFTRDAAKLSGHYYTDKAIGSSLIGLVFYIPLYAIVSAFGGSISIQVFKELITFLAISLLCAILAPLLYSFVRQASQNSRFSLLVTSAICFGTGFYTYSTFYYAHSLVGMFLFVVFFLWFHIKNEENINHLKIMISGYLMGFAIITEYPMVAIVFALGLYILFILWQKRRLFDFKIYFHLLIGFLIPVFVAMLYNDAVFHHPFKTGYGYEMLEVFRNGHETGFMGIGLPNLERLFYMTLHPTMGIFLQSPFLLLAFLGWFQMWKALPYRAEAIFSFGVVLGYFLLMSGYYVWWGGAAFTPRILIPILPFFGIPLGFLTRKWEKALMLLFALIAIAGVFVVTATSIPAELYTIMNSMPNTSIALMFQQQSTIYHAYLPAFLKEALSPNRGQEFFHLSGFQSLIPLLLIETGLLIAFMKITSKKEDATQAQS